MVAEEKNHEVTEVIKEPKHEPQDTKPILITIVYSTTKTILEAEIIESSLRPQLIVPILNVPTPKQPKTTREVHLDPDALVLIDYEINRVMYKLTNEEIQAQLEKQDQMERATQEQKLVELSNPELSEVVEEAASKAGVDPKALCSLKGGKEFLKIQDAEYNVLQREHLAKLKKIRFDQKRKTLESEPEVRIAGLECNRSLLEGILFVNNKVIETHEHEIFFINAFGD
uniref:Uncharacterized protein n=1 Tax=Tanacetum cinerariifolium TaxID=118510 RepID=A0A6L2L539_TANCI|nr:hypothetical protein [Tanacetum cinerariifolium]